MAYSLDDAHETMARVYWDLGQTVLADASEELRRAIISVFVRTGDALDAIEADLPEPCSNCGDDSCRSPGECLAHITIWFDIER